MVANVVFSESDDDKVPNGQFKMSQCQPLSLTRDEYAVQDVILQYISSHFVSIKDADAKFYKKHLGLTVETLIEKMKEVDPFFCLMFNRETVAGSYWDNLKVGSPEEFDKCLVLSLPSCFSDHIQFVQASPSFVLVNVKNGLEKLKKTDKWESYRKIDSWIDRDGNIIADKVRSWMEGVIQKAINSLPHWDGNENRTDHVYTTRKSGPAMTVEVVIYPEKKKFDLDLVPVFEFQSSVWPQHVRKYPSNMPELPWHVVFKPLTDGENKSPYSPCIQWRLSFHFQEAHKIHNTHHLKAVLKLLKKLRDCKIDQNLLWSYAIKTVFLWEMDDQGDSFWQQSLSVLFLHMLNVLVVRLRSGNLPFYWQKEHNLLDKLKEPTKRDLYKTVENISNQICDGLKNRDWFAIAKVILTPDEYEQIQNDVFIDKSNGKVVALLKNNTKSSK